MVSVPRSTPQIFRNSICIPLFIFQKKSLPEAHVFSVSDNDMIQQFNSKKHAGFLHPFRKQKIISAGRWIAAGVVMNQHDRDSVIAQSLQKDFSR